MLLCLKYVLTKPLLHYKPTYTKTGLLTLDLFLTNWISKMKKVIKGTANTVLLNKKTSSTVVTFAGDLGSGAAFLALGNGTDTPVPIPDGALTEPTVVNVTHGFNNSVIVVATDVTEIVVTSTEA